MSEVVQLLPKPDPERDEAIFKAWRAGKKTIQQLARDYNLPQTQITAITDQYLPLLTPRAQVRELSSVRPRGFARVLSRHCDRGERFRGGKRGDQNGA